MIKVPSSWTDLDDRAKKDYETAVGTKTAIVYAVQSKDHLTLCGDYFSEGHNILECVPVLIPLNATPEVFERETARFFKGVEDAIDASYARKLYLSRRN